MLHIIVIVMTVYTRQLARVDRQVQTSGGDPSISPGIIWFEGHKSTSKESDVQGQCLQTSVKLSDEPFEGYYFLLVALTVRFELGIKGKGGFSPTLSLTGSYLGVLVETVCLWRKKAPMLH